MYILCKFPSYLFRIWEYEVTVSVTSSTLGNVIDVTDSNKGICLKNWCSISFPTPSILVLNKDKMHSAVLYENFFDADSNAKFGYNKLKIILMRYYSIGNRIEEIIFTKFWKQQFSSACGGK